MRQVSRSTCFYRIRTLLGLDSDIEYCPHVAVPVACWCHKPPPWLHKHVHVHIHVYSTRNAVRGSIAAARRAGTQLATSVMPSSSKTMAAKVSGSVGLTW